MSKLRAKVVAVLGAGAALIATGLAVTAASAGAATTGCRVDYAVSSQWPGGGSERT